MAKSKQQASAAQRREQTRQQRQQRLNAGSNKNTRRTQSSNKGTWLFIGGIVLMVVVVIAIFVFLGRQSNTAQQSTAGGDEAQKALANVNQAQLATVGTGNAQSLLKPLPPGAQVPKGPTGKPLFLYAGADYCPYCGAQRWAIITALSRFGKFGPLESIISSESNVPTYTFHNVTYTSQYIDFVGLETEDNNKNPLDKPSAEQQKLIETYNAPPYTDARSAGSIPFLLISNQQTSTGAFFNPQVLVGHTYDDIAGQVKDPNSDIAKGILGSANYLTAAICKATNNQPADVCTAAPIPQIQRSLPKPSADSRSSQSGVLAYEPAVLAPRRPD